MYLKQKIWTIKTRKLQLEENVCNGGRRIERIGNHQKNKKKDFFKFVGVKLDKYLDWTYHGPFFK